MDSKEKSPKKVAISIILGFVVALVAMGLPMIGITVNLRLGSFVLLLAFILLAYGFLQWETVGQWREAARVSTLWILGLIYSALVGVQIYSQYQKDHPRAATVTPIIASVIVPKASPNAKDVPDLSAKKPQHREPQIQSLRPSVPKLETPQPQQQTINAPNGIAIGGGTVMNPTVNNFVPPQRIISKEQIDHLRLVLAGTTGNISSNCPMSDDEGCTYAENIRRAFGSVGWNAGPHVGLTVPTGKKQPFVYVGLVDPHHLSPAENLVLLGLKTMNVPFLVGHSDDARGSDVPIFIDAEIVPFKQP